MLRFGVIGLGIGRVHVDVLNSLPNAELRAVCDLDKAKAKEIASAAGVKAYTDFVQMIEKEKLDAVSLCTNPKNHLPIGAECAKRGIHVLCEKPMGPSVEECLGLAQACEDAGVVLLVAQKKRFAPGVEFLKAHIGADFGAPISANYRFHLGQVGHNWFWQEDDGGGPLVENAVHAMDTLRWLLGDMKTIRGIGGNLFVKDRAPQIDIALGLIEFQSGAVAAVEVGAASEWAIADEELFIGCEKAVVRARGRFDQPSEILYVYRAEGKPRTKRIDYKGAKGSLDFVTEISHFIDCVENGTAPRVPGRDAAKSVAACLALKRAVREGKVVKL